MKSNNNNANILLKSKTPLSPSRHSIGQQAAVRTTGNSNDTDDTDCSEDLNPTPRESPIFEDFDIGDTYGNSNKDADTENNNDNNDAIAFNNVSRPEKNGSETNPLKKRINGSDEDSIVFNSNPIVKIATRERVDEYRHRVAIAKEKKRIEEERKRRKAEESRIAKIIATKEKRLKEEEEARIAAEKVAEEARLAKEAADLITAALEETERQVLKKREEELLAARIVRKEDDERDIPSAPLQYIHEKPPTPVKAATPIMTGVGSGIYTGLGIGLVASMVRKSSDESSKIEEDGDDGVEDSSEELESDDGAWHDNYHELKQQLSLSSVSAEDEVSVFDSNDEFTCEKGCAKKNSADEEAERQAAEQQAAEEVERLAIEEKQRLEKQQAEEEEFIKRAKALEYQKKIEEKRKMKKKADQVASMEAVRAEAAERLASFEKMAAFRAAMKAEADRKKKEKEEEQLKKRSMGLINVNTNIVTPLTSALLAAIDFVDYKGKLDMAQIIAQKVEAEVSNVMYGEIIEETKDDSALKKDTSKESIPRENQTMIGEVREEPKEEVQLVVNEELKEEVKEEVNEEINEVKEGGIEETTFEEETPLRVTSPEVQFAVDPAYTPEDIKSLSALYSILYSGFDVTKKSTFGKLQKRVLYCDALMTNLSWKEPANERKRADSVISMFNSKKTENERLLDFNLITNVTADKKVVIITHPTRTLEVTIEDEKTIEILVTGLSVYARYNPSKSNTPSRRQTLPPPSRRQTLPPSVVFKSQTIPSSSSSTSSTISTANNSPQSLNPSLNETLQ